MIVKHVTKAEPIKKYLFFKLGWNGLTSGKIIDGKAKIIAYIEIALNKFMPKLYDSTVGEIPCFGNIMQPLMIITITNTTKQPIAAVDAVSKKSIFLGIVKAIGRIIP